MIKPYYQDEHATIYHGDSLEIMPQLQYDLIVTDPPYGIEGLSEEFTSMTNGGPTTNRSRADTDSATPPTHLDVAARTTRHTWPRRHLRR